MDLREQYLDGRDRSRTERRRHAGGGQSNSVSLHCRWAMTCVIKINRTVYYAGTKFCFGLFQVNSRALSTLDHPKFVLSAKQTRFLCVEQCLSPEGTISRYQENGNLVRLSGSRIGFCHLRSDNVLNANNVRPIQTYFTDHWGQRFRLWIAAKRQFGASQRGQPRDHLWGDIPKSKAAGTSLAKPASTRRGLETWPPESGRNYQDWGGEFVPRPKTN